MDSSDSCSISIQEGSSQDEGDKRLRSVSYACNFLQPLWVRCAFRPNNEVDRFLLDYGRYLLLPLGIVLWALLLLS